MWRSRKPLYQLVNLADNRICGALQSFTEKNKEGIVDNPYERFEI